MAAKHFNLTLAAAAKRLSDVYGGAAGANPSAALDIPYREIQFTATGADAFLGSTSAVTSTDFGTAIDSTNVGAPVRVGPYESGPVKLSDFWVAGAGATLHILAIPF